jgi:6-phosphogluconolactonase
MSFLRAARAALAGQRSVRPMPAALIVVLIMAGLSLSCGNSQKVTSEPDTIAYVSLPGEQSVLQLFIDGGTGVIKSGAQTPQVEDTSPTGLALTPARTFLYAANSRQDTISIFSVNSDGTLSMIGPATPAGNGPDMAVIDPSGQYLLVTNNYGSSASSGDISVYSINAGSGLLTEVAGSPFPANANPTNILFTHSGNFVYVTNPGIGMVTGFAFCPPQATQPACADATGVLTVLPGTPVFSGDGAAALTIDATDSYLYVANPEASNLPPYQATEGNISAFSIDSTNGNLTPILGSPFTVANGGGPSAIAIDPTNRFVYATTPGSSDSIWCFSITPTNGDLVLAAGSPFSLNAGGLFALFDTTGSYLYIGSDSGNSMVGYTYNLTTGGLTAIHGSPFSIKSPPGNMVVAQ